MTTMLALGWALVDSLWQDALAAAALAALLAVLPARIARTRYLLACVTLLLMFVLPLVTAVRLAHSDPGAVTAIVTAPLPAASGAPAPTPGATILAPAVDRIRGSLEPLLPWIVVIWLIGVIALSLRLASGWVVTRRLQRVGTTPVSATCRAAVARLARLLRVSRPIRVLQSAAVQVPTVAGWLRPVILLPASALTGLTPWQLDALLAHELAHVRRLDYVVNLIQSVIETLLFYHPAVWWVSRTIREEREHCCDDLAVRLCGDAHLYATALLGMERLRVATPVLAMTVSGGSLVTRVRRLIAPTPAECPRWIAGVVAVALLLGGGTHFTMAERMADLPSTLERVERLTSVKARREAVKRLGHTHNARALTTLVGIARGDADEDVQREAVEAIGRLDGAARIDTIIAIARTHPNSKVRRKAVEAIGNIAAPLTALAVLDTIALRDGDPRVEQEAAEELGHMRDPATLPSLAHLARTHPDANVRDEALEQYAKGALPESALVLLRDRLTHDAAADVQHEAIARLAELPGGLGIPALTAAARSHPDSSVRAAARRRLP
jgi:beta-lactamase regulating signal transducer with metallopeptidase domain